MSRIRITVRWDKRSKLWDVAMASLSCTRYRLHRMEINGVYTTTSGYRGITAKRRDLHIPNTPGTQLVESLSYRPASNERG